MEIHAREVLCVLIPTVVLFVYAWKVLQTSRETALVSLYHISDLVCDMSLEMYLSSLNDQRMKRNVQRTPRPVGTLILPIPRDLGGQGPQEEPSLASLQRLPRLPRLPNVRPQRPQRLQRLQRPQSPQSPQRVQRHLKCKGQTTGITFCRDYASQNFLTTYVQCLLIIDSLLNNYIGTSYL